jgi:hypothetical protein
MNILPLLNSHTQGGYVCGYHPVFSCTQDRKWMQTPRIHSPTTKTHTPGAPRVKQPVHQALET